MTKFSFTDPVLVSKDNLGKNCGSGNEEHEPQMGHHPEVGQWQTGVEELCCCPILQLVWRVVMKWWILRSTSPNTKLSIIDVGQNTASFVSWLVFWAQSTTRSYITADNTSRNAHNVLQNSRKHDKTWVCLGRYSGVSWLWKVKKFRSLMYMHRYAQFGVCVCVCVCACARAFYYPSFF